MIDGYPRVLTIVGAVGAGLTAGVFFTFSTFVMTALRRLPPAQGMSAMQAINKAAPTSAPFMTAFVGVATACVVLAISAFRRLGEPVAVYQLVGCALYIAGFLVTAVYHVPRNNALGLADPHSAGAAAQWSHYLGGWMAWNHVRTRACLAGAVSFTLALEPTDRARETDGCDMTDGPHVVQPIGRVESPLVDRMWRRSRATRAPEAWLVFEPRVADGLRPPGRRRGDPADLARSRAPRRPGDAAHNNS